MKTPHQWLDEYRAEVDYCDDQAVPPTDVMTCAFLAGMAVALAEIQTRMSGKHGHTQEAIDGLANEIRQAATRMAEEAG